MHDDIGIYFDARGMGSAKGLILYGDQPWHCMQLVEGNADTRKNHGAAVIRNCRDFWHQPPGMPTGNVIHDNECWCRIWVAYYDKLTEKNMDSAGNQVHPEKVVEAWNG